MEPLEPREEVAKGQPSGGPHGSTEGWNFTALAPPSSKSRAAAAAAPPLKPRPSPYGCPVDARRLKSRVEVSDETAAETTDTHATRAARHGICCASSRRRIAVKKFPRGGPMPPQPHVCYRSAGRAGRAEPPEPPSPNSPKQHLKVPNDDPSDPVDGPKRSSKVRHPERSRGATGNRPCTAKSGPNNPRRT